MKKKIALVNLLMSVTVLFTMLFQTVHTYEHFFSQLKEKHCEHHTSANQKEITHSHSIDNQCSVCHFAFSTFITDSFQTISFLNLKIETQSVFLYTTSVSIFFKGSFFSLRAPPAP